jgi:hypothetical protein
MVNRGYSMNRTITIIIRIRTTTDYQQTTKKNWLTGKIDLETMLLTLKILRGLPAKAPILGLVLTGRPPAKESDIHDVPAKSLSKRVD